MYVYVYIYIVYDHVSLYIVIMQYVRKIIKYIYTIIYYYICLCICIFYMICKISYK